MCKYKIEIEMGYGNMNINCGDDYKVAIDKYKDIKEEYKNVNCTIRFYNCEMNDVQFIAKPGNKRTFDDMYDDLICILVEMTKAQIELCKSEKSMMEIRNSLYHQLEVDDLSQLTEEEQIRYLFNMKKNLNQRRIIETENQKHYAFNIYFKQILKSLERYNELKDEKNTHGSKRYSNEYYTETHSIKKNMIVKLLNNFK